MMNRSKRPPWSSTYPFTLLNDDEEEYVRFCAFNNSTVNWAKANSLPLAEVDVDDHDVVFGSSGGKNTARQAALKLFRESYKRIVGRKGNKLLQFPLPSTYNVYDLIEENDETLALFARAHQLTSYESGTANGSLSPPRPRHQPTSNSVSPRPRSESQASSLSPRRPQHNQQLAPPSRHSETPSTAAVLSRTMSDEYIYLNVGAYNVRGIIFVPVTEIKVKKGSGQNRLIDCFTFLMPLEDGYYFHDQQVFEAWMHDDNGGFTLTVPARNAFDIQNKEAIAQRASKDFPKAKQEDLQNQILLSIEKHSAPSYSTGQKKEVGVPAKPSQANTAVDVPLMDIQFRFQDDITCRPLDFDKDESADESGQNLKVTIFPVTNYPCADPMVERFKANYVLEECKAPGADAKVIACTAFEKTYIEEVVAKFLRGSSYLKITMQKESVEDKSFGDSNKTPKKNHFDLADLFDSLPRTGADRHQNSSHLPTFFGEVPPLNSGPQPSQPGQFPSESAPSAGHVPPLPDSPMDSGNGSNTYDAKFNEKLDSLINEMEEEIDAAGKTFLNTQKAYTPSKEQANANERRNPKSRSVMIEKGKKERKKSCTDAAKEVRKKVLDEKRRA
eukprot:scaffold5014_cov205-Skeletonema_menzelii.AAC.2